MPQDACPQCGNARLVAGILESTGTIRFRPNQTKFFTFRTSDIALKSYVCSSCGYLMVFGDAQKLRDVVGVPACEPAATREPGP